MRMGHHDDGGAFSVKFVKKVHHLRPVLRVEIAGRLVGQDKSGIRHRGAGNGHTLLLAARQLVGIMVAAVRYAHALHGLLHTLYAFRLGEVKVVERQHDIVAHGHFVNKVERLEYESDFSFAECGAFVFAQVGHLTSVEHVATAGGIVEQSEDVEQG